MAFVDKAGNLWFGSELGSGNSMRIVDFGVMMEKPSPSLQENMGVPQWGKDISGNLWIGTRNTSLCRFDRQSFTTFSE